MMEQMYFDVIDSSKHQMTNPQILIFKHFLNWTLNWIPDFSAVISELSSYQRELLENWENARDPSFQEAMLPDSWKFLAAKHFEEKKQQSNKENQKKDL